jgi:hypothetical protein
LEQRYRGNAVDLEHQWLFADRGQGLTGRQLEYLGVGVEICGVNLTQPSDHCAGVVVF